MLCLLLLKLPVATHTQNIIPTKFESLTNSICELHGVRGPVVGPRWYSLFLISTQALSFES